ncbi:mfs monocarboxylate [Botryosphaeria dothidea]|uniref:Mfs monocarboxylate n=1 Tax=Botryosphaeria dothidea TaxID=55169 RepID=A0A8H4J519_9PEZI|nr:mfs monocarboxylate [Botryosphaeria dothidea]
MASVSNTVLREDHPVPAPAGESVTTATVNAGHPAEILEVETEQETDLPLDGGKTAWLVLAATSLIQVPVWGFSIAFGVIQEYYESPASGLVGDKGSVPIIGTTTTGILYLSSPLTFTLLTLHPSLRHWFGPIGLVITSASFFASAFVVHIGQLIALQGVLAALGTGLLFATSTLCLDELFARRKGLAYGIMWAGKSATGVGLPFAIQASLDKFGHRTTMLGWAFAVTIITAPLLFVLRPRRATSSSSPSPTTSRDQDSRTASSIYTSPSFWALQTGNVLQSLGYFLPAAYLPSYATRALALPARTGTLLLALLNATSVPGGIVLGMLCDRPRMTRRALLVSSLPSAVAVLCCWGLAGPSSPSAESQERTAAVDAPIARETVPVLGNAISFSLVLRQQEANSIYNTGGSGGSHGSDSGVALLVVFALCYGFFAGGFSSTWSGVLRELQRENPRLDTGLVFGLLAGGRGVGNVVSGPISVALMAAREGKVMGSGGSSSMSAGGESGGAGGAYGSEYGPMILFTGASALLGAWGWLCQRRNVSAAASSWRRALAAALPSTPQRWSCVSGRGAVRAVAGAWRRARLRPPTPTATARTALGRGGPASLTDQ